MSEALRMDAYYYSFDPTGERSVDVLLSAIAWAGKCYHHTEDWREEQAPRDSAHTGSTPVDWIQHAATATAAEITALRAALDQERAKVERLREYAEHISGFRGCATRAESFARYKGEPAVCTCGLDALLSGRGEGGSDG